MQNSYSKITYRQFFRNNWSIIVVILLTPLLLHAVLPILPTHDDWAAASKPDFNPFFIKERFLFYGYHWRPFDAIIGWIVGRNPQVLWPTFNHYVVVIGHAICAYTVFQLLTTLLFERLAKNIAVVYFFLAPATMATASAIDSINQVYALIFGITSFLFYVKQKKIKYVTWIITIVIATWWKENGLMWALIGPILAYGFDFIDKQRLKKDICIGIGVMATYALAIFLLPKDIIIHPEYEPGLIKMVNNFIKFVFTTFITTDYIYLLHKPSRNLWIALISFLLTVPFLYYTFIRNYRRFLSKEMVCTIFCMIIAVGPHLGTIFSMMHTYAGMAMLAIIIAYTIQHSQQQVKMLSISFLLFCISAIIINIHLIKSSIYSGLIGKQMAQEVVKKTGKPVKKVYVIIIEDEYPKLSSFCVIPNEAFGWGYAVKYETNYKWPEVIQDTTINRTPQALMKAKKIGHNILNCQSFDCIWIVNHKSIDVIKR